MDLNLKEKVVIVTGAGRGIGRTTASALPSALGNKRAAVGADGGSLPGVLLLLIFPQIPCRKPPVSAEYSCRRIAFFVR